MRVGVIGTGYVGLVTGTCLAELGHTVQGVDIDAAKIEKLRAGISPIHEPGLDDLMVKNVRAGRLTFTTDYAAAVPTAEIVIIAVGTPSGPDGQANLEFVEAAAKTMAPFLKDEAVVMIKSTVPVGTGERVAGIIRSLTNQQCAVVSCPEFLREGQAVTDFFNPDRIVIGGEVPSAINTVLKLFEGINAPKVVTNRKSSELIKYASNAFLATKISFINEIANVCDRLGADIDDVARGMGFDNRIGPHFLKAGIGYGGSCFPKDVRALSAMAGGNGYDFRLLKAVIEVNNAQRQVVIAKLNKALGELNGKRIAVLGLAFKNNTDDIRESAAIDIIRELQTAGAAVVAYDPVASFNAKGVLTQVEFALTAAEAARQADAVLITTEWDEFKDLDWSAIKGSLKQPIVIDGRNILNQQLMMNLGYQYQAVGRSA